MTTTHGYHPTSYGYPWLQPEPTQGGPIVGAHPMTAAVPHAATVVGVPLCPGERVVYFHKPRGSANKKRPTAQAVTTLRVIHVPEQGAPVALWLQSIGAVEAVRRGTGGAAGIASLIVGVAGLTVVQDATGLVIGGAFGGAIGGLINSSIDAAADRKLDAHPKTTTRHWDRSEAVVLVAHDRKRHRIDTKDASRLGLLLANGMVASGFDHLPGVWYEG